MESEIWVHAKGYCERFEVSNFGNVRTLGHVRKYSTGSQRSFPAKLLRLHHTLGYRRVAVTTIEGKQVVVFVHRLVAENFIPNPNNYPTVNHIDNVRSNNHYKNLEWLTYEDNTRHAHNLLHFSLGIKNGKAKLTEQQVLEIFHAEGSLVEIGREYSITSTNVDYIKKKKIWKHLHK